ncbi:MAG: hypothetical protein Kilf2KO_48940 [Rhodospirillales bacterium]
MSEILGDDPLVFIGLTCILFGGTAFMMGQAVARTWRPLWLVLPYGLLLTGFNRFLTYGLFDGDALSIAGFLVDGFVICLSAYLAYRMTRAHKMVVQYPWLFERSGLLGWREKTER